MGVGAAGLQLFSREHEPVSSSEVEGSARYCMLLRSSEDTQLRC